MSENNQNSKRKFPWLFNILMVFFIILFFELLANLLIYSEYYYFQFSLKKTFSPENIKNWLKEGILNPYVQKPGEDAYKTFLDIYFEEDYFKDRKRLITIPQKVEKKPIVIFGCSFAYGDQ